MHDAASTVKYLAIEVRIILLILLANVRKVSVCIVLYCILPFDCAVKGSEQTSMKCFS